MEFVPFVLMVHSVADLQHARPVRLLLHVLHAIPLMVVVPNVIMDLDSMERIAQSVLRLKQVMVQPHALHVPMETASHVINQPVCAQNVLLEWDLALVECATHAHPESSVMEKALALHVHKALVVRCA